MRGLARAALAVLLGAFVIGLVSVPQAQAFRDKDCADFSNQKKAQKFYKKHNPKRDPHNLDGDNDGIACEDNPCPCANRTAWFRTDGDAWSRIEIRVDEI